MAVAELTLVLSGHLRRPQSADLRPFWRGFIELQKKLPADKPVRQIVAHSWNPEIASLASFVYGPTVELHEDQPNFNREFLHSIEPPDLFERGLDRANSTWRNVSIQSVMGNARSRAEAARLLDRLSLSGGSVLITRWDLGQSGTSQVNRLVADAALPDDYIYLSYFSEVDEGYADMWILAPWEIARRFGKFDAFVLESLAGRNSYLELFCKTGWPRSRVKTYSERVISHPIGQRILSSLSKIIGTSEARSLRGNLITRIKRKLLGPLQRRLECPVMTAENSCVSESQYSLRVFPNFLSLNIHALLKYFILAEGLREKTRFLTHEDFEISCQTGQIINPLPFVLLLWEGHGDQMVFESQVKSSPLPVAAAIKIQSGRVWSNQSGDAWDLASASDSLNDRLSSALDSVIFKFGESTPVLIMPSLAKFLGCVDWYYLNSLIKYIFWSRIDYVGFVAGHHGRPSLEFPGLDMVRGGGAFSLKMAAGTAGGIRSYLSGADPDLKKVCERANRMMLEFPVVANVGALF